MSFDNEYPNRKDHREEYRGAKRVDSTCRNHGSCDWCRENRLHGNKKRELVCDEEEKEILNYYGIKNK